MTKLPSRYWDSSAFIAYFKAEEGRVELCQAVIDEAKRGQTRIITSALTLSEVVHIKGYEKLTQDLENDLESFFEHDFVVLVDLNRAISEYARKLMWRHGLRAYDANHLSSAIHADVHFVDAFDDKLLKQDGKFSRSDGTPIRIGYPNLPIQTSLKL
ncbi:MAG: type II toxin-antitoxin system VapC family toxin [Bacteroidota bacterium]